MLLCIALVVMSYVLPIFVGTTATRLPYSSWEDGTFTKVRTPHTKTRGHRLALCI